MAKEKTRPLDKQKFASAEAWRRQLKTNYNAALQAVEEALDRCRKSKLFHPTDIDRFRSQMLNGTAVPNDFAAGRFGKITRS